MSQHLLNCPEVSSCFDKVGCERVAEGMRTDLFLDARLAGKIPDNGKYHSSCKSSAPAIQKDHILIINYRQPAPVNLVQIDLLQGFIADRYEPLLVTFSCDAYESFAIM
jgi:hypothetical protein